jgi:Fe-S-cluster containining protein
MHYDCLECGACCRQAGDGTVLVYAGDIVRWKREGRQSLVDGLVPGHFGELAFPYDEQGACLHLGTPANKNACSIYETRGWTCHALIPGSAQCFSYRRAKGFPVDEADVLPDCTDAPPTDEPFE